MVEDRTVNARVIFVCKIRKSNCVHVYAFHFIESSI